MIEDMRLRNFAPGTIPVYVNRVARFARHFGKSPELLGPEDVRSYLLQLIEGRRPSRSCYNQNVQALRFLYPALEALIGTALNARQITAYWDEILRLATSIQQGTVTASLMLRKLGAYPRQNGLALALRELGRLERSLFTLEYLKDVELRRRIHVGLNKGEARNALARAVFFNRLGELRDRTYENQRHRANGLNLVVAAIVLWNTVYIERAVKSLRERGQAISDDLLAHLSPLGWEHINLTGDYVWKPGGRQRHRPLRQFRLPIGRDDPGP
jgi:hypothetical protein